MRSIKILILIHLLCIFNFSNASNNNIVSSYINVLKENSLSKYIEKSPDFIATNENNNLPVKRSLLLKSVQITANSKLFEHFAITVEENNDVTLKSSDLIINMSYVCKNKYTREYQHVKSALTSPLSTDHLHSLTTKELKATIQKINTKIQIISGYSAYALFNHNKSKGFICFRHKDCYSYGQIWLSDSVYLFSSQNVSELDWPTIPREIFPQLYNIKVLENN